MNVNPLSGYARLAGVGKAADRAACRGPRQIGVRLDDDGGVAAELERDAFRAGLRANGPAGLGAAGERDEANARVLDQDLRDFDVAGDDVDGAVRVARCLDEIAEAEGGERILRRRFEADRRPARHRRGDFVRRQEYRKVERRDGGNRRQREAPGDRDAAGARRNGVGGEHFSLDACRFLG